MDTIALDTLVCETCTAIKQAKPLKPLWYGGWWLTYKWERPGRSIISPSCNPPRQAPCTYCGGNNHWMTGNICCAPCHHSGHYPGPWKACPVATSHLRKNWVRQWDWLLKEPHKHLGQRAQHWVVVLHPPSCTSLQEIKWYNWLLKTTMRAMGDGTSRHWDIYLAIAAWFIYR